MPARTNPQVFPAIFGPYDRTEMLAALHLQGPIRSPVLKRSFGGEAGRAIKRAKANPSRILAAVRIQKGRHGCADVIGINPTCSVIPEIGRLLDRLMALYPLRHIANDIRRDEVAQFYAVDHPSVDLDCLLGTSVQTRTLVALWLFGGELNIGKLQRSVFDKFVSRVRVAIKGFVKMGVLVENGVSISFNQELEWLPELLDLLAALAPHLSDVVAQVEEMKKARSLGNSGTAHAYGTYFRLFGSRVNQAILVYLAAHGPSPIMAIMAAVASVNPGAIEPLIDAGLVCRVTIDPDGRSKHLYSLNAANPVYPELRALLRTPIVQKDAFPVGTPTNLFDGEDFCEPQKRFLPYTIFGVSHKKITTKALSFLVRSPNMECEVTRLKKFLGSSKTDANTLQAISKALKRLEEYGVLVSRPFKTMTFFRFAEKYEAFEEFLNLLFAIGEIWVEFQAGALEDALRSDRRRAMERGRTSAYGELAEAYLARRNA